MCCLAQSRAHRGGRAGCIEWGRDKGYSIRHLLRASTCSSTQEGSVSHGRMGNASYDFRHLFDFPSNPFKASPDSPFNAKWALHFRVEHIAMSAARNHYKQGIRQYGEGKYDAAIASFDRVRPSLIISHALADTAVQGIRIRGEGAHICHPRRESGSDEQAARVEDARVRAISEAMS